MLPSKVGSPSFLYLVKLGTLLLYLMESDTTRSMSTQKKGRTDEDSRQTSYTFLRPRASSEKDSSLKSRIRGFFSVRLFKFNPRSMGVASSDRGNKILNEDFILGFLQREVRMRLLRTGKLS